MAKGCAGWEPCAVNPTSSSQAAPQAKAEGHQSFVVVVAFRRG
jgi:hypothetical protein